MKKSNGRNAEEFLSIHNSAILENIDINNNLKKYLIDKIKVVENPSLQELDFMTKIFSSILNCENNVYATLENLHKIKSETEDNNEVECRFGNYKDYEEMKE
jgi:hypothetical protein